MIDLFDHTGELSVHAQILGTVLIVILMISVFELIRRNHLQERYAVLWVIVLLVLLAFMLIPGLFSLFSSLTGVRSGAVAFLAMLSFLELVLVLHLSSHASKQNVQVVRLYQKLAILEEELNAAAGPSNRSPAQDAVDLPPAADPSQTDASAAV